VILFHLRREVDVSGVSGTGCVAEGAVLSDGRAVLHWLAGGGSLGIYQSIEELIRIHGHGGATEVEWNGEREDARLRHFEARVPG
jgi:hypothetical protein